MPQDAEIVNGSKLSAKSCLPQFDPDRHFSRQRIISTIRSRWTPQKKALLIEAQAGQGKSTLAIQMLAEVDAPSAWHQLGSEDGDPVQFLAALHDLFKSSLTGFASPLLETMLANGEINALGAADALTMLLDSLETSLRQDFYLVLDDVYLLEEFPLSLTLLDRLLQLASPRLKLVLISRTPILPLLQSDIAKEKVLLVGNADLALSRSEIATLFNDVLHQPIASEAVQALHQTTEGWIMGVILVASKVEAGGVVVSSERLSTMLAKKREKIPDYFIAEVLSQFSPALRRTLAKLALLKEIPLSLAKELSEVDDVEALLVDLQQRNFFVRSLDGKQRVFAFHHLFRDCLRDLLEADCSSSEIEQTQREIASWYLDQEQFEKALNYYLRGHDFEAAVQVLQQVGMTLHARNRIVSLQAALARAPEEVIGQFPWLAYYQGIVVVNTDPPNALHWFELAHDGFSTSGDELGELMSLVQILYYHMAIDSRYNLGRIHLQRASDLLAINSGRLTPPQMINAANILLLGYALFDNDTEKADQFYGIGLKMVLELGLKNLEAETRLARFYRNLFLGDHERCRQEIEQSLALLGSPRVNVFNKAMLLLAHLNLLVNDADHDSYDYRKGLCRKALGEEMFDKSVFGAFVRLWDIDMYFAQGEMVSAREEIREALGGPFAGASAHLRSQYLQYQAYLLACDGREKQALAAAGESMELRAEVGCPFFESFNAALIGAAYAQLGRFDQAEDLFVQGLSRTDVHGDFYARPTLLAHRAFWRLTQKDKDSVQDDLRELFGNLRVKGFRQLWLCTPELMTRLLSEAVQSGIEVDYARKLAADRYDKAIYDDGSVVPLLKIHTLGRFEIEFDGEIVLRATDLSGAQRQLLALLLAAPEQQLHQEEAQTILWPDRPAGKSRSSFDTLTARLRKVFDAVLHPHSSKDYLSLKKGYLCLENCRIDAVDFISTARQGMTHLRKNEFWQGDNVLRKAMQLWQGEYLSGIVLDENAGQMRLDLLLLYLTAAQHWSEILAAGGQTAEAIEVCSSALPHDPTNEALTRTLYNLHIGASDNVSARKVLARYTDALRTNGFSPEESAEILEAFWAAPA